MADKSSVSSSKQKDHEGSTAVLIENGQSRGDPARIKQTMKLLLMVLLGVVMVTMFISLSLTVIHLNDKINNIAELSRLQQELRLDIGQELVDELLSDSGEVKPGQSESGNSGNGLVNGLHLIGAKSYQRIDDDHDVNVQGLVPGMETISNWQDKSMSGSNSRLRLVDGSTIQVEEDGFYLIYAQLTWRMKGGVAVFEITKNGGEATLEASSVSLAKCINTFQEKYAIMKSCYTSAMAELRRGDSVWISVVKNDLSIEFDKGRSFFGAVSLDRMDS